MSISKGTLNLQPRTIINPEVLEKNNYYDTDDLSSSSSEGTDPATFIVNGSSGTDSGSLSFKNDDSSNSSTDEPPVSPIVAPDFNPSTASLDWDYKKGIEDLINILGFGDSQNFGKNTMDLMRSWYEGCYENLQTFVNRGIFSKKDIANFLQNCQDQFYNYTMSSLSNLWSRENWEYQQLYNSPINQIKRLVDAGVNPAFYFGSLNTGAAQQPASAASPSSAKSNPYEQEAGLNGMSALGGMLSGLGSIASVIPGLGTSAGNVMNGIGTMWNSAATLFRVANLTPHELALYQAQAACYWSQSEGQNISNQFNAAAMPKNLKQLDEMIKKTQAETKAATASGRLNASQVGVNIGTLRKMGWDMAGALSIADANYSAEVRGQDIKYFEAMYANKVDLACRVAEMNLKHVSANCVSGKEGVREIISTFQDQHWHEENGIWEYVVDANVGRQTSNNRSSSTSTTRGSKTIANGSPTNLSSEHPVPAQRTDASGSSVASLLGISGGMSYSKTEGETEGHSKTKGGSNGRLNAYKAQFKNEASYNRFLEQQYAQMMGVLEASGKDYLTMPMSVSSNIRACFYTWADLFKELVDDVMSVEMSKKMIEPLDIYRNDDTLGE